MWLNSPGTSLDHAKPWENEPQMHAAHDENVLLQIAEHDSDSANIHHHSLNA